MLTGPYTSTHATSPLFRDAMERRGRSRAIPTTAVMRKNNRHQRQLYHSRYSTYHPSPSPSPIRSLQSDDSASPLSITPPELSFDYYESPPTPPQSLQDQIQEAYALDNIHLAKILYLKLRGIHVVDDSDPRIEQVREEDFPFGKLILDEEDESSLKESQRIEAKRQRDKQRASKLAQCERSWNQSVVEYRQQCLLVQQRKQAASPSLTDRLDRERQEHQPRTRVVGSAPRSLLSYNSPNELPSYPTPGVSCPPDYPVPTTHSSPVDIPCRSPRSSGLRREPLAFSQSIPFQQVSACMNGALFSDDDVPSDNRARKRQSHVHTALLEALLQPVTWMRGERSEARIRRRSSLPTFSTWSSNVTLCSACPSTSGSPSTIVSSYSGHQTSGVRRLTISSSNPTSSTKMRPIHCGAHSLTSIDLQECPLSFPNCSRSQPRVAPSVIQHKPRSIAKRIVRKIGISVTILMDVAAQFQASYLRTAGHIAHYETGSFYDEEATASWGAKKKIWLPFDPTSPRANISQVLAFIEGSAWSEIKEEFECEQEHYTLVQLISPSERNLSPPAISPLLTPSPLRSRDAPTSIRHRIRPIANPVLLRLKALQNVCAGEGVEWEGRAREGALGFGRDRLQGVAFDGIGRSRLSLEVSF